ncbi:hypothetical protein [Streptomyces sp. NPDC050738]|uniref:hypothetical protein n=1 Tax=Streptomyces sp. NPDC050738 TaxID=3154744 RepID=UPI0034174A65
MTLRSISEASLPPQALAEAGRQNETVLAIAAANFVRTHDAFTGEPRHPLTAEAERQAADAATIIEGQQEALIASRPHDERHLAAAASARLFAGRGAQFLDGADAVVDGPAPLGRRAAGATGSAVLSQHQETADLAVRRSARGSLRHLQHKVPRWAVVAGAVVLGGGELFLLWQPALNLGGINSFSDAVRWGIGGVFALGHAGCTELLLHHHQERERVCHDLRESVQDRLGASRPSATAGEFDTGSADRALARAQALLVVLAGVTAGLTAVRVAVLCRQAGQSALNSGLFGSAIGFVFGSLVLVLALVLCRGSGLGDQLAWSARAVAVFQARHARLTSRAAECLRRGILDLAEARSMAAHAEEDREYGGAPFRKALYLAASWRGKSGPAIAPAELARPLPMVKEARANEEAAEIGLRALRVRLAEAPGLVSRAAIGGTGVTASAPLPTVVGTVLTRGPGRPAVIIPRVEVPRRAPQFSLRMIGAAALLTLGLAASAAALSPAPDGLDSPLHTVAAVVTAVELG